ncbi:MAG TPA: FUSC family membrane protein [Leadbetterella sp.]|nr:FUSC family membrane protein [Leadbetterella sp.]
MPQKLNKHINSFDFFRASIVSILLVLPIYWGFSTQNYPAGMSIVVGVMFAYFSNIEGTNRNRIIGMFYSLSLGLIVLSGFFLAAHFPDYVRIPVLALLVFGSSMLSVFGFRGSMIGFAGLFAVVMGFMLQKYTLPTFEILKLVGLGGIVCIIVSALSQFVFQKRHIQLLLAECIELTANYLKMSDDIKWNASTNTPDLQYRLLKTQSAINENHELLRSMLMSEKSTLISSSENRKLYLLFIEMIDLYEMAIAWNPDFEAFEEELGKYTDLLLPYQKASELVSEHLIKLSEALRTNSSFGLDINLDETLADAENSIKIYVDAVKLPKAREGALMMRNLLDHEQRELEKLKLIDNIYNNLLRESQLVPRRNSQFITTQNYSWNTIKINLNTESVIFRHSIRLTTAFLLSFLIGQLLDADYANWIIVTTMVILRPNYGLTKSRAKSRMAGTILGMVFTLALVYFFKNSLIYGTTAALSLLIGFSFINKNYKIASAGITISILLLYVLNENDSIEIILNRGLYTFVGVLISLFAMYFIWPVWEKENIKDAIKKALIANLNYLKAVNNLYRTKQAADTAYRLIRKDAFIKNGNLNGAFQRLQEEPKSKKSQVSNIYAAVLLNHSFLSGIAAYSAYIQSHKTTNTSENFEAIMEYICVNLQNAIAILKGKNTAKNPDKCFEAFEILEKKYAELNQKRNLEIESGIMTMSTEMRSKLQEAKVIIEQLKWLKNLSENVLGAVEVLG